MMCISSKSSSAPQQQQLWNTVANSKSISEAVTKAIAIFRSAGVSEPDASASHLALSSFRSVTTMPPSSSSTASSHLSMIPPTYRVSHTQMGSYFTTVGFDRSEMDTFVQKCDARLTKHTPIQYLVGEWDFHRISLLVKPPTLIPRPETEVLVDLVLDQIIKHKSPENNPVSFIDVGCGCGAITLALLCAIGVKNISHAVAIDPCPNAVSLTRENIHYLQAARMLPADVHTHVSIVQSCMREYCNDDDVIMKMVQDDNKFDFIVSNPPYIPTADIACLDADVKLHESRRALDGGVDGLDVVCDILQRAPHVVKTGGFVLLEVDTSHPALLQQMLFEGLRYVDCFDDWYGRQRFVQWQVV